MNQAIELTGLEKQIIRMVGKGYFNRQIAEVVGLSEKTIWKRLRDLKTELGVETKQELFEKLKDIIE